MLGSAIIFAFASAAALFILLIKLNIRRVLGYDVAFDILMTVVLVTSFSGTVTGMAAAMIAGVVMSLMLLIAKTLLGYERLERDGLRLRWKYYPPKWERK